MTEPDEGEVTRLLARLSAGDREAEEALYLLVHCELHRIASAQLSAERPGHTLQPTALVNEAYLRLCGRSEVDWQNRMHFFRVAAKLMRRILVDYARQRRSQKRGCGLAPVELEEYQYAVDSRDQLSLALAIDELLETLGKESPRLVQVVEMRFYAQLSEAEIAAALGVSERTVKRDWFRARAWLHSRMSGGNDG